jgi:protein gp37
MQRTKIEWTHSTWNPSVGCTKISPGCMNCYAEIWANRLQGIGVPGYENGFCFTEIEQRLVQPLKRKRPTVYFVNSMSDLFHENASESFIDEVFEIIKRTPQHTFQILTKRAERMSSYFRRFDPPENVWLGVSVEDNQFGVPRIDFLKSTNPSVRFLSIEPLLEELDLKDLGGINWVIVGGESGGRARAMNPNWVFRIQEQCCAYGIPFFFKQWGAWGEDGIKRSKAKNGRMLMGKTWDGMP